MEKIKTFNTRKLVTIALMIALDIVLTRFLSISTLIIRIGFGFLPTAIIAMLFGPLSAGLAAVLSDIIGVNFFSPFAMHPGFTISAFLTGMTYGFFMYKRMGNTLRIVLAVLVVTFGVGLGLNTLWLSMIQGVPYFTLIPLRALQQLIMAPIQIVTIKSFSVALSRLPKLVPLATVNPLPK